MISSDDLIFHPVLFVLFQLSCLTALEAELSSVTLKVRLLEDDKMRLLKEMEERDGKVMILTASCDKPQ